MSNGQFVFVFWPPEKKYWPKSVEINEPKKAKKQKNKLNDNHHHHHRENEIVLGSF